MNSARMAAAAIGLLLAGCASHDSEPVVDNSATAQALHKLPRRTGERVPVTLYEFRSSVPEVSAQAATDMFLTALVGSGQFAVQERHRLYEGVIREKQLNAAGQTTGTTARSQLRGARYVFEGTVSEANASGSTGRTAVNIGGAQVGHASNTESIGVDVRIVNANTGEILDAVNVRKELNNSGASVSGLSTLAGNLLSMKGRSTPAITPDVAHESSRKESVDAALRSCIQAAVLELSRRFQE